MFYSHEILSERLYGVGTVWLVATVGTSAIHTKVTRKAILAVNLPMACKTVMSPEAPLALRLQSSLLYGISKFVVTPPSRPGGADCVELMVAAAAAADRVYDQQCRYFLNDVNQAYTHLMRAASRQSTNPTHLTLTASARSRPDGLLLSDDPAFILNLNDLVLPRIDDMVPEDVDSTVISSFQHSLDSSSGGVRSQTPFSPSSSAPRTPGLVAGRPQLDSTLLVDAGSTLGRERVVEGEEEKPPGTPMEDDIGLTFHLGGQYMDLDSPTLPVLGQHPPFLGGGTARRRRSSRLNSEDFAGIAEMEHEEGRERTLGGGGEIENQYAPEEFGTPETAHPAGRPSSPATHDSSSERDAETPSLVEPMRRLRRRNLISDRETELAPADIQAWRDNYLDNMAVALKKAQAKRETRNAKANAKDILFRIGFFGELKNPVLKDLFSAEAILDSIGKLTAVAGGGEGSRKRSLEGGWQDGEDEGGRRVRPRSEIPNESELGLSLPNFDEPEVGRRDTDIRSDGYRPSSQATLPWNRSDLPGSRPLSVGGFASSSVRGDFLDLASRRGSRQSSPLAGRIVGAGGRISVLGSPIGEGDENTIVPDAGDVEGLAEEFEFFGPGINADTQEMKESQWLAEALEKECQNFLGFVKEELARHREADQSIDSLTFEQLIPPTDSNIVASQAFSHILSLATRNLLKVSQEEPYGTIQVAVV